MRRTVEMGGRMGKMGSGWGPKRRWPGGVTDRVFWSGMPEIGSAKQSERSKRGLEHRTDRSDGTLLVQNGTQDRDDEMGEVRCAFVELEPADDAVIG